MQAGPPRYASQSPAMRPNYPQGAYAPSPRPGFPQMPPGRMGMPAPGMSPHSPYAVKLLVLAMCDVMCVAVEFLSQSCVLMKSSSISHRGIKDGRVTPRDIL
ncbi:hypothetical protein ElyMa_005426800 [Elysia marginata]|uniref:Uncharacterized protein n=1 Tax=Elysia marginata TaxID=1093978 RepID=A0AAV4EKN8_9GAST|nr:hypothetical protein ElyMa_005426800 [Elysia marginata]